SAQLRYVRLIESLPGDYRPPPSWATSGHIFYGSQYTGPISNSPYPYILGGDDVQIPTEAVLSSYQAAGGLPGYTLASLRELYRAEGIALEPEETEGYATRHVLEGGRSLVCPLPGTTGFVRIFGQVHPAYRPRSDAVRAAAPPTARNGPP